MKFGAGTRALIIGLVLAGHGVPALAQGLLEYGAGLGALESLTGALEALGTSIAEVASDVADAVPTEEGEAAAAQQGPAEAEGADLAAE